ncbi:MAG: SDR family NAD(P)-dependent oxidoreductase [Thermofilaceae archaeon]
MKAVITGASSGIGKALCIEVCSRFSSPKVLGIARREEPLKDLSNMFGERFDYIVADLSKPESLNMVFRKAQASLGKVDLLVNNAGFGLYRELLEHSDEELISMTIVNFIAPINLTKKLLPLLHNNSAVVNVLTTGLHFLMLKLPAYGATKIALHYATEVLRRELKSKGIRVVSVYPGVIDTEFHRRAGSPPPSWVKPIKPEQVAKAILDAIVKGREKVYVPQYTSLARIFGPFLPMIY